MPTCNQKKIFRGTIYFKFHLIVLEIKIVNYDPVCVESILRYGTLVIVINIYEEVQLIMFLYSSNFEKKIFAGS